MANEFVARKGLIVPGTGSINVISGSVTASNFVGTASAAISSSFATTASYSLSGEGFPYTGNAVITGSLNVTQAVTASYFKGDGSQLVGINVGTAVVSDVYKFVGDGTTQLYVLSQSYYVDNINVSVDGLVFTEGEDFNYLTGSVFFLQVPPTSSNILIKALINATNNLTGSFTGSFFGNADTATTASYAITSSYASNVLKTKAGAINSASFTGTPYSASVIFATAFPNTNYAVVVTGEDARSWTVGNKTTSGFIVNSNSNVALTGTTYWTCTAYGEN